ncbi:MAG: cytochrome c oxidase subunit II [Actinomycetes bacterium]
MSATPSRPRRRLYWRYLLTGVGLLLALTGCTTEHIPAFGFPEPITKQGHKVMALWKGSSVAALAVGVVVWGLILVCIVAFRKRNDDLPPQVHYNIPIEILYTVLPFVMVGVLFFFTAKDENYLNKLSKNPDVTVNVVGYQWAWQFNYVSGPAAGLEIHGRPGQFPELVLPVGEKIQFALTSPDVVHAFWLPEFLFKRDVVPGRVNRFELTVEKIGRWHGACTELCGVDHSRMLFTLRTVSQADFQTFAQNALSLAKSGQNGDRYTFDQSIIGAEPVSGTANSNNQGNQPGGAP